MQCFPFINDNTFYATEIALVRVSLTFLLVSAVADKVEFRLSNEMSE